MKKVIGFFRSYGAAILVLSLIIGMVYIFGYLRPHVGAQQYMELTQAIDHGKILQGTIVQYRPYRAGFVRKASTLVDEGVEVIIEFVPSPGEHETLVEKWPLESSINEQDMLNSPVGIYYYPQNEYVQAVSFLNPRVQFYLKNKQKKAPAVQ